MALHPVITPDMHAQAAEIAKLMDEAVQTKQSSITYHTQPNKKLHPFIIQLLTSKGYIVEDVTHTLPNGQTSFVARVNKSYTISIE